MTRRLIAALALIVVALPLAAQPKYGSVTVTALLDLDVLPARSFA